MIDLNDFVPSDSDLHLRAGATINDRGEIAVEGFRANGFAGSALLIPCDNQPQFSEGCREAAEHASASSSVAPPDTEPKLSPEALLRGLSARSKHRYHTPGSMVGITR